MPRPKGFVASPEERQKKSVAQKLAWAHSPARRAEQSKFQTLRIKKLWADRTAGVISGKYKNSDLI
jgi:hypothetical protein